MARPNSAAQRGSPLPQETPPRDGKKPVPIHIANGFFASLPAASRLFFQRIYFSRYPRPIQAGQNAPFPRQVPIITLAAPKQQAIVLRAIRFRAFIHSGIGREDVVAVDPSRITATAGFRFLTGNQSISDYDTNLTGSGVPRQVSQSGQQLGLAQPRAGGGNLFPFAGLLSPSEPECGGFATYVWPGESIQASAVIFRPPDYDLRFFAVEMCGWITNEVELRRILDVIWG